MNTKKYALQALVVFGIAFIVSVVVTYLYNLILHNLGVVNWQTSITLAIVLAIVIPWVERRRIV